MDSEQNNDLENEFKHLAFQKKKENKEDEDHEALAKVELETYKWLISNPEIKAYFEGFNEISTQSFKQYYALYKAMFVVKRGKYLQRAEEAYIKYIKRADLALREILYKKLFDYYFQWSANLVKHPEMGCSYDFYHWFNNIMECPSLEPIDQSDIDLYIKYLGSDDFEMEIDYDWDGLLRFIESDEKDTDELPEWFQFHNIYTKGGQYFHLPNVRKELEQFYIDIYDQEMEETKKEKKYEKLATDDYLSDRLPFFPIVTYDSIMRFMNKFEDAKTIRDFQNFYDHGGATYLGKEGYDENQDLMEEVEGVIYELSKHRNLRIPVEASNDWRKALIKGWNKWEREQIRYYLPAAFDNYLFRIQNNIPFEDIRDRHRFYDEYHITRMRKKILTGREFNGEPRDFDF